MQSFVEVLKLKRNTHQKFINEIADVLNISYFAAHRRVSGLAKFTLEEALTLAKHFQVSLDALLANQKSDLLFLKKIEPIKNWETINNYLYESQRRLSLFSRSTNAHITYSSKDIPIFYTLKDNELSKLKFYSWLWMLDENFAKISLHFKDFHLPENVLENGKKLSKLYENASQVSEFWNETTLNSVLYQLKYFYDLDLIHHLEAEKILFQLKNLLQSIELKAQNSTKENTYNLYWNEMLVMNNSILIETATRSSVFIPFNMLSYLQTSDAEIVQEQQQFFNLQKQNSTLLSAGNQKMRKMFFKNLYQQIDSFSQIF